MPRPVLLATKFHAPRHRGGVVDRPRLHRRLDLARLPALTLVSAPAGFGKTTLLAEWLDETDRGASARPAWVSLDPRDNDPTLFWSYLVAAVATPVPGVGEEARALLQGSTSSVDAVVTSLLNDLTTTSGEIVLILDDYHVVESIEVHESVRFLVEHLPSNVHLVLAGRSDPPWPLAGLRARGELLELRGADLRFDAEEAATYFRDAMGLALTGADINVLEARTEGWITALQLAALSMRGRDDIAAFIEGFAGDDRFILDYLVDEVLDRQTPDARDFLLRTCLLSRLSAELCDAVVERDDSKAMLDTLERANLFLVPLDDRRLWYRYHHLFGDVLQARLVDEHPGLQTELHRRASEWHEQHDDRPEAIRHSLAGQDFERAADLVELAVPAMRRSRREATMRTWFEALPAAIYTDRPVLAISWIGARMATGQFEGIEDTLDQIEHRVTPGKASTEEMVVVDEVEFARLPAQVAMYRTALALLAGDIATTIDHAEHALELTAANDHHGIGAASALLGLAHWAQGDLEEAQVRYVESIDCFRRSEHHADILGCTRALADIQVARGHLGAASRTLEAGLELARTRGPLRGTADMHAGLADVLYERNDLDAARAHGEASRDLDEHLALPQNAYRWRVALARLLQVEGDRPGALDLLADAELVYDTDFSPSIRPVPAVAARMHLLGGDLDAARRWVAETGIAFDDEPTYRREYEHLTLARVLIARSAAEHDSPALDEAVLLLDRLRTAAETAGRAGSAVEILALRALVHHAAAEPEAATTVLGEALIAAEPEGFVRPFLDEGQPLLDLLQVVARGDTAAVQARRILAAATATSTHLPDRSAATKGTLVDPLSDRELQVVRLLRSELTGPEIARELMVSLNTMRTHTKNIYMKLGVNSRRAAVRRAAELGL